jgi:hypothetical protein
MESVRRLFVRLIHFFLNPSSRVYSASICPERFRLVLPVSISHSVFSFGFVLIFILVTSPSVKKRKDLYLFLLTEVGGLWNAQLVLGMTGPPL